MDEEHSKVKEVVQNVEEANGRVKEAIQRADDAKAKAVKAVETWKESPKFDALAQDAYVVALEDLVKHVHKECPDFDAAFLEKALDM